MKRLDKGLAAAEAKGEMVTIEQYNDFVRARDILFETKKWDVIPTYGSVVKQEFSTEEGWEERPRGVSEARQVSEECGSMYGIKVWERDGVGSDSVLQPGEKIAIDVRKEL